MKTISVIGMGYIGLPTALLIAGPGKKINCIDKDKNKINDLKNGKIFLNEKPIVNHFNKREDVPATTVLSDKISKDLKKRGFKFVGSTVIYAYMQATGMVNDHTTDCFRYNEI